MTVDISVIIPCYNAAPFIGGAIDSVLRQGMDRLEIIVVDDGSTDASVEAVRRACPDARIVSTANKGPSHARNRGFEISTGKYVQFLDADDLLADEKIRPQMRVLEDGRTDIVYGDWRLLDAVPGQNVYREGAVVSRQMTADPVYGFIDGTFWAPTFNYLYRREIIEKCGGWKEDLPMIEDVRFTLDCALKGARFFYMSHLTGYYRRSPTSLSQKDPLLFNRCCFENAGYIEGVWRSAAGLNEAQKRTLTAAYFLSARSSYRLDPPLFEQCLSRLNALKPNFRPDAPAHLAFVSRFAGYRNAERLAFAWRGFKRLLAPEGAGFHERLK